MANSKFEVKILTLIISIWVILQIFIAKPASFLNDWMCWRQADTQTIAINFLNSNSNIFYPQINWGGNGPGYVEAEFQLYTFLIAQIMKITGESILPGQLLSLLFIVLTTIVIYLILLYQFKDRFAALLGAVIFLISKGAIYLSTTVQPDALCIFFYSLSLFTFLKYLSDQKNSLLVLWVFFSILAALIKPLALNIGIIQFFIIFFLHRHFLKSPKIWIGWLIILVVISTYLLFSYNLYLKYGNTFGVLGGERKFANFELLSSPINYLKIIYMIIFWGLGPLGTIAFIILMFKKKFTGFEWSMIIGNLISIFVGMKMMISENQGPQYYIFMTVFGSWLVCFTYIKLDSNIINSVLRKVIFLSLIIIISISYTTNLYSRTHPIPIKQFHPKVTALGLRLKKIVNDEDLVIVRSIANGRLGNELGNGKKNYEDPRIFYIAGVKGWSVPFDLKGFELIEKYFKLGAAYYVEPFSKPVDSDLDDWLKTNSKIVFQDSNGRIYKYVKN